MLDSYYFTGDSFKDEKKVVQQTFLSDKFDYGEEDIYKGKLDIYKVIETNENFNLQYFEKSRSAIQKTFLTIEK